MFQTLKNAWKTPELKSKILFTLMIIILYRLGSNIPMPWVNPELFSSYFNASGSALGWLNIMSGGALAQATLFALSVSPYITASIVIQLLTIAIPKFEEWAKEGEAGKKKLSAITRGLTVVLALVTSIGYTMLMANNGMLTVDSKSGYRWFVYVVLVLAY
jgi:preprotein translocase subunit SecY